MSIITVSRQLGSMGTEIAHQLADELNFNLMTRELFSKMLQESGFSDKKGFDIFSSEQKPSFLEAFLLNRDRIVHYIKKVVYEFAQDKDVIIIGLGGQIFFQSLPDTLRVRVVAPLEDRIKRVWVKSSCDQETALRTINESDHVRASFDRYFFDLDWDSASLYDLVINTGNVSVERAIRMIKDEIKTFRNQQKKISLSKSLKNLALKQKLLINILYQKKIPVQDLKISVRSGAVVLEGYTRSAENKNACEIAARETEGVKILVNEISAPVERYKVALGSGGV